MILSQAGNLSPCKPGVTGSIPDFTSLLDEALSCGNLISDGPRREKTCFRGAANNKGADQPAHPRSLISAFVIRSLQSVISTSKNSNFYLVSVAEETGF